MLNMCQLCHPTHSPKLIFSEPFEALGGYRREEAIMLLRKFYLTENIHGEIVSLTFIDNDEK